MELEYLADHEKAIPIIADWYYSEWGHLENDNSIEKVTNKLHSYLNRNKIPLIILAIEGDNIWGVSQLKYHEMDIYPEKEHWLGGVYVSEKQRGKKIADKIIGKIISDAVNLNVHTLYLQTERLDGGLYKRLGWQPIEQVNYRGLEVLVMKNEIGLLSL